MRSWFNRVIIMVTVLALLCSGCEPLRKKFTRKKKSTQVEDTGMIPVLQPEEYPEPKDNPMLNYRQHYELVRVFYKELWRGIEEKTHQKTLRYTYGQVIDHLNEMKSLLNEDKAKDLENLIHALDYYHEIISLDTAFWSKPRLQSDLRAFHRQLIGRCKPEHMKNNFKSTGS